MCLAYFIRLEISPLYCNFYHHAPQFIKFLCKPLMKETQDDPQSSISFLELPFKRKISLSLNEPYLQKLEGSGNNISENPVSTEIKLGTRKIDDDKKNTNFVISNAFIDPIFADCLIALPRLFDKMLEKVHLPFVFEKREDNILSVRDTKNGIKVDIPVFKYKDFYKYNKGRHVKQYEIHNIKTDLKDDSHAECIFESIECSKKFSHIILLEKKSFLRKEQKKETERYKISILKHEKYVPNVIKCNDYIFQLKNNVNIFYVEEIGELPRIIKSFIRKSVFVPKVKISKNSSEFVERFLSFIPGISPEVGREISIKFGNLKKLKDIECSNLSISDSNRNKKVCEKIRRILNSHDENERIWQ